MTVTENAIFLLSFYVFVLTTRHLFLQKIKRIFCKIFWEKNESTSPHLNVHQGKCGQNEHDVMDDKSTVWYAMWCTYFVLVPLYSHRQQLFSFFFFEYLDASCCDLISTPLLFWFPFFLWLFIYWYTISVSFPTMSSSKWNLPSPTVGIMMESSIFYDLEVKKKATFWDIYLIGKFHIKICSSIPS